MFQTLVFKESEAGSGMSKDKLILFAKENGYELTQEQIKNWSNYGIIPRSVRVSAEGKAGSAYEYPAHAYPIVLLALSSHEKRSLERLLIDVWLRGGDIEEKEVQKILEKQVDLLGKFVQSGLRWLGQTRFLDVIQNARSLLPHVANPDKETTIALFLNVLSPKSAHAVWQDDWMESEEERASQIAYHAIGIQYLAEHGPLIAEQRETPEMLFQRMKDVLNVSSLRRAIRDTTYYKQVQKDYASLAVILEFMGETAPIMGPSNPLFRFIGWVMKSANAMRPIFVIGLLACYQDPHLKLNAQYLIQEQGGRLDTLRQMTEIVRHMKTHPLLKKKKNWLEFFSECEIKAPEKLEALREFLKECPHPIPELS